MPKRRNNQLNNKFGFLGSPPSASSSSEDESSVDGEDAPNAEGTARTAVTSSTMLTVEEGEDAASPRVTFAGKLASGIFGAVERLMFGSGTRSQLTELDGVEKLPQQTSSQGGRRSPTHEPIAVTTVAIEDPQAAWMRRHMHRLRRPHSQMPPTSFARELTTAARFSNAIAAHDRYDDDDPYDPRHVVQASKVTRQLSRSHQHQSSEDEPFSGTARAALQSSMWMAPPTSTITVEVASAIDAYQNSANEYYGSIVQAALAQRGPHHPIRGDELRHAAGNPYLMQLVLGSGALDCNDTENQQIVQDEIDFILSNEPTDEQPARRGGGGRKQHRLDPSHAAYLKMLFLLPTSHVSQSQVKLLENSGFEFVKLLHDNPHILRHVAKPPWWQLKPYEEHRTLDLLAAVFCMVLILVDLACLAAIAIHWWQTRTTFGYWTALIALGGYLVTLVVVVVFESSKVDSSFYDERLWEYPSSNVKVVPLLPLLELMLLFQIAKYYIASKKEGKAFFVITHDLHASFTHLFILHSQCHSFPQILIQNYLFTWGSFNEESNTAFRILLVTASISCCSSLLLFLRRIACFRSVNGAGFSVFGSVGSDADFDSRGEFFPKILTFLLFFMLEYNVFFLIVAVTNVGDCSTTVLVWIFIMGGIIVVVVVILVYSLAKGKSSTTTGRLSLAPVLAQAGFAIYGTLFSATQTTTAVSGGAVNTEASCAFYSITLGANVRVGIATFSVMLAVWVFWVGWAVFRRYKTMNRELTFFQKARWLLMPRKPWIASRAEEHSPAVMEPRDHRPSSDEALPSSGGNAMPQQRMPRVVG